MTATSPEGLRRADARPALSTGYGLGFVRRGSCRWGRRPALLG
ncbi:hypothetical protein [Prauserella flavalba]